LGYVFPSGNLTGLAIPNQALLSNKDLTHIQNTIKNPGFYCYCLVKRIHKKNMRRPLKILLLEDSFQEAELIQRLLLKRKMKCEFHLAMDKENFLQALDKFSPDVILSDNSLPQFDATEALKITRERSLHLPFILVTGTVSEEFAANIIKQGADDYILKDRMIRLPTAIDAALRNRESEKEKLTALQNLMRSEEKYRQLVERVSDGFIALDTKWNIVYANKIAEEMLRRPSGYLVGKNLWAEFPDAIDEPFYEAYHRAMRMQKNIHLREYSVAINRWVETSIFPSPSGLSIYFRDITDQKKAEEEIQKNEEQYRDLIENITDLICTHDLNGRILSVNKAAEELIGHKFNPKENLNIRDILDPDKKDLFDLYITELKTKGRVQGLMKVKTFTGKIHIWEYNNSLKKTDAETAIVRGYARDITESRKAEEKLRQSEIRLNEAQALAHISSWEIDFAKNIHTWSDEFYRIYGLHKDEVQPSAELFLSFMHPDDADFAQKKMQEAFDTLKNSSFNFRFIRKDSIIRHGYTEWRFEFDKKGRPLRLYGIVQDITDRKEAEEERKKLEFELQEQQRNEQIKITATALEAQEKERSAIGEELHDNVNQILVGTKLMLSMIKNKSEEAPEIINTCIINLQNAIQENRKLAHELVTPDFETTDLVEQISNMTDIMLKTSGIDVFIDTSYFTEELLDNQQKLAIYRIAQEQCTNIVKYAKGSLTNIFLSTTDGLFKMIISDDGKGMETGEKTDGIGLRNIKGRLSIFNGTANINTEPGKGFTLEITIPFKK
jgi:PAS domain S-box-containing protein